MPDSFLLAFKLLPKKNIGLFLSLLSIVISSFLLMVSVSMGRLVVDTKSYINSSEGQYRQFDVLPVSAANRTTKAINLYTLLSQLSDPTIECMYLTGKYIIIADESIDMETFVFEDPLVKKYAEILGPAIEIDGISIEYSGEKLIGIPYGYDLFSSLDIIKKQETYDPFSAIKFGRSFSEHSGKYEVIIDDALAYKISGDVGSLDYDEAIASQLGKEVTFDVRNIKLHAQIVGIYDSRMYMPNAIQDHYSSYTLYDHDKAGDVCIMELPIFLNERLIDRIDREIIITNSDYESFQNYHGTVGVIVGDLMSLEKVVEDVQNTTGLVVRSQIIDARKMISRITMFENIVFVAGITMAIIALIALVNTLSAVVFNQISSIRLLRILGHTRGRIGSALIFQGVMLGGMGGIIGVIMAVLSQFLLFIEVKSQLHEMEIASYITTSIDTISFMLIVGGSIIISAIIMAIHAWSVCKPRDILL